MASIKREMYRHKRRKAQGDAGKDEHRLNIDWAPLVLTTFLGKLEYSLGSCRQGLIVPIGVASNMAAAGAGEIEFVVKNPSRPTQEDIRIRVPASGTVRDLKLRLQAGYPGRPEPSAVTVNRVKALAGIGRW